MIGPEAPLFVPTTGGGWRASDGARTSHPPYQRHSDTSRLAASSASEFAANQEAMVERFLRDRGSTGATDEEVYQGLIATKQITPETKDSSIRRARVGLVNAGIAHDSGRRRETRSGRSGTVWVILV